MKRTKNNREQQNAADLLPDGGKPKPDGGQAEAGAAPFRIQTSGTMSRKDRYKLLVDEWMIAPAKIIWEDWRARVGTLIILFFVFLGTVATWFVEPTSTADGPRLIGPFQDWSHPLGTDNLGRDIFSQTVHATPMMLEMILAGAVFTTIMATVIGTVSGYKGGFSDRILMTFTDILMTIPGLPLVIVIAVILEPEAPWLVGIILTINAWAGLARAIRSQVLTLRSEAYVEASRLMGISTPTILAKDVVPGLAPYILINFVNTGREVIFASVGLYFLGILPMTQVNWGVMMQFAYDTGGALYTVETAHWLVTPMAAVVLLSFGLILFAQGTDRVFNPRVRARHTTPTERGQGDDREDMQSEIATQLKG